MIQKYKMNTFHRSYLAQQLVWELAKYQNWFKGEFKKHICKDKQKY